MKRLSLSNNQKRTQLLNQLQKQEEEVRQLIQQVDQITITFIEE